MKSPKLLVDEIRTGRYVRAWKQGRSYVVQVWNGEKPDGDPVGDWEMPGVLGLDGAVFQALIQSPPKPARKKP